MKGLPPESATWRDGGWTTTEELLAQILENQDTWGISHAALMRAKPSSLPKPIRVPRPGREEASQPRRQVEKDPGVIRSFFARIHN